MLINIKTDSFCLHNHQSCSPVRLKPVLTVAMDRGITSLYLRLP